MNMLSAFPHIFKLMYIHQFLKNFMQHNIKEYSLLWDNYLPTTYKYLNTNIFFLNVHAYLQIYNTIFVTDNAIKRE